MYNPMPGDSPDPMPGLDDCQIPPNSLLSLSLCWQIQTSRYVQRLKTWQA